MSVVDLGRLSMRFIRQWMVGKHVDKQFVFKLSCLHCQPTLKFYCRFTITDKQVIRSHKREVWVFFRYCFISDFLSYLLRGVVRKVIEIRFWRKFWKAVGNEGTLTSLRNGLLYFSFNECFHNFFMIWIFPEATSLKIENKFFLWNKN